MCEICQSMRPFADKCDYDGLAGPTVIDTAIGTVSTDYAPGSTATGAVAAALPVFSYAEIAHQLTNGYWEASNLTSRSFALGDDRTLNVDITGLTAAGQTLARGALQAWSSVTGITFAEVQSGVSAGPVVTEVIDAAASTSTAYTMASNGSFNGTISAAGDRDWVKVTLTAGQTYTIMLKGTNVTGELADPYLRLMNSAGTQIAFNDDSSGPDSAITFTAATGGTYYVVAGAYGDSGSGTYKLSMLDGNQSPDLVFDDASSGAFTSSTVSGGHITSSSVNISTAWLSSYGTSLNSYSFQTYIHEIGHALGLGHAGNYNGSASYGSNALYANDSWQASVMSYFSQDANTYVSGTKAYTLTPMIADILAIQNLYGTPNDTRSGNTTYGENSTAGGYLDGFVNMLSNSCVTLFDSDGIDTLDLGTRTSNQRIDLRVGTNSDINGKVGNLSIALNTVIEKVITGSGADNITGNGANNRITTQGGDDTIQGGFGNDRIFGGDGNDVMSGDGGSDWIFGGAGNDRVTGGDGVDMLFGGTGADIFVFGTGSARDVLRDFSIADGDRISLDHTLWTGSLTAAEVVETFGRINLMDRLVLNFGDGERLVFRDFNDISAIASHIDII